MTEPVGIWLLFDHPEDEDPSHEANVTPTSDGRFTASWYHTAVGQVTSRTFDTRDEADRFLADAGYQDFTS